MPVARVILWLVSLALLAWCALSVRGPVPSAALLGAAFSGLFLYATLGVLWPRSEMYGAARWRGKVGARAIALTFDDGPHPVTTRAVLRILREHDVRATFFVLGHKVVQHPDVVQEIHAAGHTIGVHGFEHPRLFCLRSSGYALAQIRATQRAIEAACGLTPTLFRPPVGFASHLTFRAAERAGVELVAWTVRSLDGLRSARAGRVAARVTERLVDGAIVLLHDAAENDDFTPASIAALPEILRAIRAQGYSAVGLDDLPR